jgi:diguanylate cyclase (GGDEF)-like protein
LLDEINVWLACQGKQAFSGPLEALYEARLGPTRRRHLALALCLTALAVLIAASIDRANAPAQFAHAFGLRALSVTFCVAGAFLLLRAQSRVLEAAIYCVPLLAQMVLAVWVGTHGSVMMIDRNILGSLMLFAVLVAVPPVPGGTAWVLSLTLFGCFVASFIATAGASALWLHGAAALSGAVSLSVGAALSTRREQARRREFVQTLRAELTADELSRVNAEAERLMHTDVVTGVANRRRFETDLHAAWPSRAALGGLGLLLIDVDFFKKFNDAAGHAEGDICLRQIAGAISGVVRGGSFSMARWGGEEFVVLAPGIAHADILGLGERVRRSVEALLMPHPAWPDRFVTVSIGAAWCGEGSACETPEDLLRGADRVLYEAKTCGRNRVVRESVLQGVG